MYSLHYQLRKYLRFWILSFIGKFSRPSNSIHFLNMHYLSPDKIKKSDVRSFQAFLDHLQSCGEIIHPELAIKMLESGQKVDKPLFVITIDDGFKEVYDYMKPDFDRLNISTLIFINPNYIDSDSIYQREFHDRINNDQKKPMSWHMIHELIDSGHVIGNHGLDHYNLSQLDDKEIEIQIIRGKELLESNLGRKINYFAWPYGKEDSITAHGIGVALESHDYAFSSIWDSNYFMKDRVINRRHVEPFWPTSHFDLFTARKRI